MRGTLRVLALCWVCGVTGAAMAQAETREEEADTRPPRDRGSRRQVPVSLEAPERGVAFHLEIDRSFYSSTFVRAGGSVSTVRAESRTYRALCQAPCQLTLPAGVHLVALSRPGGVPVDADPVLELRRPSRITGIYVDNEGLRVAGTTTLVLGLLAAGGGAALAVHLLSQPEMDPSTRDAGYAALVASGATLALTLVIGLALGLRGDGGRIEIDILD